MKAAPVLAILKAERASLERAHRLIESMKVPSSVSHPDDQAAEQRRHTDRIAALDFVIELFEIGARDERGFEAAVTRAREAGTWT